MSDLYSRLAAAVREALWSYRCSYTGEEGDGSSLVDVLTPPGESSIELGERELIELEDVLVGAISDVLEGPGGSGGAQRVQHLTSASGSPAWSTSTGPGQAPENPKKGPRAVATRGSRPEGRHALAEPRRRRRVGVAGRGRKDESLARRRRGGEASPDRMRSVTAPGETEALAAGANPVPVSREGADRPSRVTRGPATGEADPGLSASPGPASSRRAYVR